jgi:hypothetical protein
MEGQVEGWAVLAEKDDYRDEGMSDLLVDYIDISRMRTMLQEAGWDAEKIHEVVEFDRAKLETELDWLEENADGNDLVLLYVAAHGSYLRDVLLWSDFLPEEWSQIASQRRLLIVDSCQAEAFTVPVSGDPLPHLSIAAVDENELGWRGLAEEGLPIVGSVFTYYFTAAVADPNSDLDGDGRVAVQEAAQVAAGQQRSYMHEVVFAVPEFLQMYHDLGYHPEYDLAYPHVILDDAIGVPLYLALDIQP